MKQRITIEQLMELGQSSKELEYLEEWCIKRGYKYTLTIGQMIEFLSEQPFPSVHILEYYEPEDTAKLCDSLWKHIKEILKKLSTPQVLSTQGRLAP